MAKEWFHDWFDSPYYHLLYSNRNQAEAENFINHLLTRLQPQKSTSIIDVACGRGRHSVYLNKKGFDVTGIDLSVESIRFARQFENNSLRFYVHDMRELYYDAKFDYAFNLFTSFGYFCNEQQHVDALCCINRALKPKGILVIDFFNAHKILANIIVNEVKIINGIQFRINKQVEGKTIIKTINFDNEGGQQCNFQERVQAFTIDDFKNLFSKSGFELTSHFGNYNLDNFDAAASDRLIMICQKI